MPRPAQIGTYGSPATHGTTPTLCTNHPTVGRARILGVRRATHGRSDRGHRCTLLGVPVTIGFDHVATLTTDMDLTVGFYEQAFEAVVTFEVAEA